MTRRLGDEFVAQPDADVRIVEVDASFDHAQIRRMTGGFLDAGGLELIGAVQHAKFETYFELLGFESSVDRRAGAAFRRNPLTVDERTVLAAKVANRNVIALDDQRSGVG